MVKEPPRLCSCCNKVISASAERHHQAGQGPPRVCAMASEVAGKVVKKAIHVAKTSIKKGVKKINKLLSARETASPVAQVGGTGMEDVATLDAVQMEGGWLEDVEMLGDSVQMEGGVEVEGSEAVIDEVQHVVWSGHECDHYRVTVEDVDDEDDDNFNNHDVDSDSEYNDESDGSEGIGEDEHGMHLEDLIDEDLERELAHCGAFGFKAEQI